MTHNIVGIFHYPWQRTFEEPKSVAQLYRRAVRLKANPRDEAYMRTLFKEQYPDGTFINSHTEPNRQETVSSADTIVLLYPDAIGLGFGRLEAEIERGAKEWTTVRVLNGRRRDFVWSRTVRGSLRFRRLVERTMLGEAIAIVVFVVATPWFLVSDLLKGHR